MDQELTQYLGQMEGRVVDSLTNQCENIEKRMEGHVTAQCESIEKRLEGHVTAQWESIEKRLEAGIVSSLKAHVTEECEKVETKLLAEFWKWGRNADQRIRRVEFSDTTTVDRVSALEERVFTLERRVAGSKD